MSSTQVASTKTLASGPWSMKEQAKGLLDELRGTEGLFSELQELVLKLDEFLRVFSDDKKTFTLKELFASAKFVPGVDNVMMKLNELVIILRPETVSVGGVDASYTCTYFDNARHDLITTVGPLDVLLRDFDLTPKDVLLHSDSMDRWISRYVNTFVSSFMSAYEVGLARQQEE